jgi:hypothetical protein
VALVATAGASLAIVARSHGSGPARVVNAEPAAPVAAQPPEFPLKVGPTGRYLVDQANRPFLVVGDSPQALIVNASAQDAADFLANRSAAGFNAVWVNLLSDDYTGGRPDGSTFDGIAPFTTAGDLSTPNEAYFARADAFIRLAAQQRLAVFLDPIETGGWLDVLRRNGVAKAFAYGRYLGERYKGFANIVWLNGNDFQTWGNARDDALVLAVAKGIRSADRNHLQTVELNYTVSSSLDDARWRGLIGLDAAYTYDPTYDEVLREYARSDFLPVFMVEANYEGEHDYTGPQTLRRQEYWTFLSGATGQFYGNKYTWPLADGWRAHLDTVGSRQMTYARNLFITRRWFDLVPDTTHQVLVSGYGTYSADGSVNDSDYATAAATRDGTLVIAYLPTQRTVTVDLAKLSGQVTAQWYDPASGTYTRVSGPPLPNSGTQRFTSPGANSDGDGDWVLVLTAP